MEEQSSAMLMATHWMKNMAISHPQTMPGGPAYPIPLGPMSGMGSADGAEAGETHIVERRRERRQKTQDGEADTEGGPKTKFSLELGLVPQSGKGFFVGG